MYPTEIIKDYNIDEIQSLYQSLKLESEQGDKKWYKITVDDITAVIKTNEIRHFNKYEEFVKPTTKKICFQIFTNNKQSPRNTKHVFEFANNQNNNNSQNNQPINGIEFNARFNERLEREREKWDMELLQRDFEKQTKQMDEADAYILKLETKVAVLESKQDNLLTKDNVLTAITVLKDVFRPDMVNNHNVLMGTQNEQTEVTFKKGTENAIDKRQEEYLHMLQQLNDAFTPEQLENVIAIINSCIESPDKIQSIQNFLEQI